MGNTGAIVGDAHNYEQLCEACYQKWFSRLVAYAARFPIGRTRADSKEEAKDIAQRTLIWACANPVERCRPAYLYRYARSRAIERIRWLKHTLSVEDLQFDDGGVWEVADTREETAEQKLLRIALMRAISQLPSREREIVHLSYWGGLSQEEIGIVLAIPEGTVGTTISRIKDKLKKSLTGEERQRNSYNKKEAAGGHNEPR